MPQLQNSELEKLKETLHVGTCPNCGFEGQKALAPMDGAILSLKERGYFDKEGMQTINVVMAVCPQCGYVSFFSKGVVLK